MKYTGPIYRPPVEVTTPLLQVTVGCTHNKCSFCTMYRGTRFAVEPLEQVEKDLQELREKHSTLTRIFLLNGDAFSLSTQALKNISKKIIHYFPEIEVITMYASIRNIRQKSDQDLLDLRNLRINELWVGIESGNDEALARLKKGFTLSSAYEQMERLENAGISHNGIYMLGTGGAGKGIEVAKDTAEFINRTKPIIVGVTTLGFFEGSELNWQVKRGKFSPATEREILEEEKKMIELIDIPNTEFFGEHPINAVSISGMLPEDRDDLLATIDHVIKNSEPELLDSSVHRSRL